MFFVLHTLILVINMFFSNTLLKYELLQPLAPICEVCGTAKPKIAKAKYATWSCKFCTLENSTKLDKCSACDQWRYSYGPPVTTYEHWKLQLYKYSTVLCQIARSLTIVQSSLCVLFPLVHCSYSMKLQSRHLLHCWFKLTHQQQFSLHYHSCHVKFEVAGEKSDTC